MAKLIIGVDEVGTGSWAGPFAVGAVAIHLSNSNALVAAGVRDSKKIHEHRRPGVLHEASHHIEHGTVKLGTVEEMRYLGQKAVWVLAVTRAVIRMQIDIKRSGDTIGLIRIDGLPDPRLVKRWEKEHPKFLAITRFEPKSDDKYPVVGAASILAKVVRDEIMVALHKDYPEYKWSKNKGYGTDDHTKAIKEVGTSKHHRAIRSLKNLPERAEA